MSKIRYLFGMTGLFFRSVFSGGKLKYSGLQKVDPSVDFYIVDGGRTVIGRGCSFGKNTELASAGGQIVIGDNVHFGSNCMAVAHEKITVESGTIFGPHVYIYDHDHKIDRQNNRISRTEYDTEEVKIGSGCWIGCNTVILKGTVIGNNVTVAAGSVVSGTVPDNSVFYQLREKKIKPYCGE